MKAKQNKLAKQECEVGDKVRIYEPNDIFPSRKWSLKVYTVEKVLKPSNDYGAYMYKVSNINEPLKENDLIKILGEENKATLVERFTISQIRLPRIKDGEPAYLVSWKDYSRKDDTVELRQTLLEDIPKKLKFWEKKYLEANKKEDIFVKSKKTNKWRVNYVSEPIIPPFR